MQEAPDVYGAGPLGSGVRQESKSRRPSACADWPASTEVGAIGGPVMPLYEYYCANCRRAVTVTLSIGEHDKGVSACPQCYGKDLHPLVSPFFSRTSRKS